MKPQNFVFYLLTAGALIAWQGCSEKTEKTLQNMPVEVEVAQVKESTSAEAYAYSGTLEESESLPLSFSGVGTISRVFVSEGDFVRKGQLVAELNNESYKNAYEMSLASQKQAEDAYKRLQPMYKNGNLPEIKLVEVETALQQAKSATAIAKKSMDDCRLHSPADGIVGKRSMEPGMTAVPNVSAISIVKIDKVFAKVSVSESEISSVKKGSTATIKIGALNNAEFSGTVEEIGVMADPIAHTYKVKIAIANRNREIKPGMICNVTLAKSAITNVLVVPGNAVLVDEKGKSFVYAIDSVQNKAVRKYVTTGRLLKSSVEITNGLQNGEQVVVAGQQKLVDNSPVHIANR